MPEVVNSSLWASADRDAWLAGQGVRVSRYPASDMLSNLDGVVLEIMTVALERRDRVAD